MDVARDLAEEYTPEEIAQMIEDGLNDIERGDVIDGDRAFFASCGPPALSVAALPREPIRSNPPRSRRSSGHMGVCFHGQRRSGRSRP